MKRKLLLFWLVLWSAVTGYAQQIPGDNDILSLGTVDHFSDQLQTH